MASADVEAARPFRLISPAPGCSQTRHAAPDLPLQTGLPRCAAAPLWGATASPPHHSSFTTPRIAVVSVWQPVCTPLHPSGLDEPARGKGGRNADLGSVGWRVEARDGTCLRPLHRA